MVVHAPFASSRSMLRRDALASPDAQVVPMYTPLWYATRVLKTTANAWWEGGIPPSRRRGRATEAVASMAAHFSRRLHAARKGHPAVQDGQDRTTAE